MFLRNVVVVCLALLGACGGPGNDSTVDSIPDSDNFSSSAIHAHWYPHPEITPGHLCSRNDVDFDEFRYDEHIPHCRRNVSKAKKIAVSAPYGVSPEELSGYQVDHLLPLSIGGSNSSLNLWPVPYELARLKARFEFETFERLKAGTISQSEAIAAIMEWVRDNLN